MATAPDSAELTKSNILLIGLTGNWQTLLMKRWPASSTLPSSSPTPPRWLQTQFVGDEIEAILHRLVETGRGRYWQRGTVSADEVDKPKAAGRPNPGHLARWHALLKTAEGAPVNRTTHRQFTHILFIHGGGAFRRPADHILTKTHTSASSRRSGDDQKDPPERLNARITADRPCWNSA